MLFQYWYFKHAGFRIEPHVSNKCHDVLMIAYELKKTFNLQGANFRCILWSIIRDETVTRLNNSVLEDKGVL